jgi:DNA uptake protein ComE-like DNA-binding protein
MKQTSYLCTYNEPVSTMIKDFFYYNKAERRGIIFLIVIVVVCLFIPLFVHQPQEQRTNNSETFNREYRDFMQSVEITNKREYNKYYHSTFEREVILSSFDPNTADSLSLLKLGLPRWMAHNILKYRSKGGKFRKPEDFKRVYGMSEERFSLLLPYINIRQEKRDTVVRMMVPSDTTKKILYPKKFTTAVRIEINTADTAMLRRIPGVGSNIARMIVVYRNRLGGYHSIDQLEDIRLISSRLSKWFTINPTLIHRLNINKVGLSRLNAHPYINFYQAKAIIEYRRKHGAIKSFKQLSLLSEFSSADFERMKYYITFD